MNIRENVRRILMPIVQELVVTASPEQEGSISLLKQNLEQIVSPFTRNLSKEYYLLTQTEIRVCNMIRSGMRSKEIANLRGVTTATISRHRESIRKKLGIINTKINLVMFLQSTMD